MQIAGDEVGGAGEGGVRGLVINEMMGKLAVGLEEGPRALVRPRWSLTNYYEQLRCIVAGFEPEVPLEEMPLQERQRLVRVQASWASLWGMLLQLLEALWRRSGLS